MKKLLLLAILMAFSINLSADTYSIENLFNKDGIHDVKMSPDGKHFVAVVDQAERPKLVVFSLANMKPVNAIKSTSDKRGYIAGINWLNNDLFTYNIGMKSESQENAFNRGRQILGSVKSSRNTKRFGGVGFIVDTVPNKKNQFLDITWNNGFYKVCRRTISKLKIRARCNIGTKGRFPTILTDHEHQVRVSFSTEEDDSQHFYYRDSHDDEWKELGVYNRYEGKVFPIGFSKDNTKIMVLINDGSDKNGVYWLDPKTNKREMIHVFNYDDFPGNSASIDNWIYDSDFLKPSIIGYRISPGKPVSIYFDENSKEAKLQRALEASFPDETVDIINYSEDGNTVMIRTRSDKNPGSLFLMDIAENKLRFLFDFKPQIKAKKMFATKSIQFKTRDNLVIQSYLTLPHKSDDLNKNLPMIVKVHGGPYGVRDEWRFDPENQLMASKGYAVLQVNYRGSGGYGSDFEYDAYNKMGAEMQDDITDATLWAVKEGFADKNRICIYGASYGGYASLMGVVKEPDLYKCAAPSSGVYDISLFHRFGNIQRFDEGEDFLVEAWGNSEEFFQERSPINHLDKLKAGLLIMHGRKDTQVDFGQYKELTKKLKSIGYPFESVVFDTEGHSLYSLKNKKDYYAKLFPFLDKYIGH